MTNMSIQPLWLTHFIEILLVHEFQLTKFIVGAFSYKAHFRPQISSNEVWQSTDGIFLGQGKYAVEILKRVGMMDCKAMATPMASNLKLLCDTTS